MAVSIGKFIHIHSRHHIRELMISLSLVIMLGGCKEAQENQISPEISIIPVQGAISGDTSLTLGSTASVWISAKGGSSNITYLGITMNDGVDHIVLDTGFNTPQTIYHYTISKGLAEDEYWTFTVMNRQRLKSSFSLHIGKMQTSVWGEIVTLDPVIMSAQEKAEPGSFFSISKASTLPYASAAENQQDIDFIYYYGPYEATFSSPSESDAPTFFPGITSWSIRNETRYDTTRLQAADFQAAINDSLLLAAYESINGKRKSKYSKPGDLIAFKNKDGKTGLIFVKNVQAGPDGIMECSIKIQK